MADDKKKHPLSVFGAEPEEDGSPDGQGDDGDDGKMFDQAADEAFVSAKSGDKEGFRHALKAAIHLCLASYDKEDEEETPEGEGAETPEGLGGEG